MATVPSTIRTFFTSDTNVSDSVFGFVRPGRLILLDDDVAVERRRAISFGLGILGFQGRAVYCGVIVLQDWTSGPSSNHSALRFTTYQVLYRFYCAYSVHISYSMCTGVRRYCTAVLCSQNSKPATVNCCYDNYWSAKCECKYAHAYSTSTST